MGSWIQPCLKPSLPLNFLHEPINLLFCLIPWKLGFCLCYSRAPTNWYLRTLSSSLPWPVCYCLCLSITFSRKSSLNTQPVVSTPLCLLVPYVYPLPFSMITAVCTSLNVGSSWTEGSCSLKKFFFSLPNLNTELGPPKGIHILFFELTLQVTKFPQVSGSCEKKCVLQEDGGEFKFSTCQLCDLR